MNQFVLCCLLLTFSCVKRMEPTTPQFPVVQTGHPVLRESAKEVPVEMIGTPDFNALIEKMVSTMRAAPGVGLAAPQIGVGLRVFVVEDTAERMASLSPDEKLERERVIFPLQVIVNPTVKPIGEKKVTFFEGCLSVAGFAALVPRFHEVELSALNEKGMPVVFKLSGWPARIVQHEIDHLNGGLYIDKMIPKSFGTLVQVKERFSGKKIESVKAELGVPQ
jgi:peptide deformylase